METPASGVTDEFCRGYVPDTCNFAPEAGHLGGRSWHVRRSPSMTCMPWPPGMGASACRVPTRATGPALLGSAREDMSGHPVRLTFEMVAGVDNARLTQRSQPWSKSKRSRHSVLAVAYHMSMLTRRLPSSGSARRVIHGKRFR